MTKNHNAITVTGMGAVCGDCLNVSELMAAVHAGRRQTAYPDFLQARLEDAYPVVSIPRDMAKEITPVSTTLTVGMALRSATDALAQAGLTKEALASLRVGICLGSSTGASLNFARHYFARKSALPGDIDSMTRAIYENPALALSRQLGKLTGPAYTITNACSSGTDAIGLGMLLLQQNVCDVVLAGGSDELSLIPYLGFIRLMIHDTEPCRPFDLTRSGLNLGEGAAILVLEKNARAEQRQQKALAFVAGFGSSADAYHLTAPHPEGKGLVHAQQSAMQQANITADNLAFINAHATGTRDNDKVEARVFNQYFPSVPISATKGVTGHTLGAAGAIEAVITICCLQEGSVPKTTGFNTLDPDLALRPVDRLLPIEKPYALSQSLAFGGHNAALVFRRSHH